MNVIRYVSSRLGASTNRSGFLSFSRGIAFISVMIGALALILSLSVLEGYQQTFKETISLFTPHFTINSLSGRSLIDLENTVGTLSTYKDIQSVTVSGQKEVLLKKKDVVDGIMLKAYQDSAQLQVLSKRFLVAGAIPTSKHVRSIMISKRVARKYDVTVHDTLFILSASLSSIAKSGQASSTITGGVNMMSGGFAQPIVIPIVVCGIYESGMQMFDDVTCFVPFALMSSTFDSDCSYTTEVRLKNFDDIPTSLSEIASRISPNLIVQSLYENGQVSGIFAWIETQNVSIPLVMSLITIVACFNILTTLLITVVEKSRSYAILMSLGLSPRQILMSVANQGIRLSFIASLTGCLIGGLLCYIQSTFSPIRLDGSIYFVDALPVAFKPIQYAIVISASVFLGFLSTLIPAFVVMRMSIINALRFR
jgi:lipoprotein-releasing system permease protein